MKLTRYDDAQTFYARTEAFLLAHEAEHCIMIGLRATLVGQPEYYKDPYLAVIEEGDEVIAAALRTPPFNLALSLIPNEKLANAVLALLAQDVRAVYPALPGVVGPAALSRAFAEEWQRATGQAYAITVKERLYRLDRVIQVSRVPGSCRRAAEADRALLVRWMEAFQAEALGPNAPNDGAERWVDDALRGTVRAAYIWEDGGASVSLVGHTGPTPHGMRVGPVYTPPELRGRGYASAATAAVTQLLLDSGRQFCFLFTDLSNPTSNSIYQKIGYQPVLDVDMYEFDAMVS